MSFNERRFLMIKITTYLLTLKIVSSGRTEVVIVLTLYYTFIYSMLRQHLRKLFWANAAGPTFSTTVCILRSSIMYRLPFRLRKVSSEVWQHTHSDDVGIGRQRAHWHQSEPADVASVHPLAAAALDRATMQQKPSKNSAILACYYDRSREYKVTEGRILASSIGMPCRLYRDLFRDTPTIIDKEIKYPS